MALLGDAISHGILPGIVLAYLFTGSLSPGPMWIGACLAGLGCGVSIEWLSTRRPLERMLPWALHLPLFCPGYRFA